MLRQRRHLRLLRLLAQHPQQLLLGLLHRLAVRLARRLRCPRREHLALPHLLLVRPLFLFPQAAHLRRALRARLSTVSTEGAV